jgi:cellulose synthase/poly-beta-1,6-N-acetylglucosamine synthase-like glycosyltransferase
MDAQGNPIAKIEPWHETLTLDLPQWLEWKPVFLGAMVFRRSLIEAVGGFRTQWRQTDDVDLVLRMVRHGCPSVWVPEVTVQYRQHEANTSRKVHQQVEELEQVSTEFFQSVEGRAEFEKWEGRSRFQSLVWSAWQLYRYGYVEDALHCLRNSLNYTQFMKSETILQWVEQFSAYSSECEVTLDLHALISSPSWRDVIHSLITKPVHLF